MSRALATSIVQTLSEAGFIAYFAGGCVRDALLGIPSTDIDIATSASPEEVIALFPKTVPVGLSFGVVIVVIDETPFEVSTFREDHPYLDGRHPSAITFSSPQKDAERRDFTINGLFMDPLSNEIFDYVGGKDDLEKGVIRAIGDPIKRFEEDRLRMIRAARFSARFSFPIEAQTTLAIKQFAHTLYPSVSQERVTNELQKMSAFPSFKEALLLLKELSLLQEMLPQIDLDTLEKNVEPFPRFPKECPLIVYLMELMKNASLEAILSLCDTLKLSNLEKKCAQFFFSSRLIKKEDLVSWAHFYAHPSSALFLLVEEAKRQDPLFVKWHQEQEMRLRPHIMRIKKREPLISSMDLKALGVAPGPLMGKWLKKAETLVIENNLSDKQEALSLLKKRLSLP